MFYINIIYIVCCYVKSEPYDSVLFTIWGIKLAFWQST